MPDLSASKLSEAEALFRAQLDACVSALDAHATHTTCPRHVHDMSTTSSLLPQALGERHPHTLTAVSNLAQTYRDRGPR